MTITVVHINHAGELTRDALRTGASPVLVGWLVVCVRTVGRKSTTICIVRTGVLSGGLKQSKNCSKVDLLRAERERAQGGNDRRGVSLEDSVEG